MVSERATVSLANLIGHRSAGPLLAPWPARCRGVGLGLNRAVSSKPC